MLLSASPLVTLLKLLLISLVIIFLNSQAAISDPFLMIITLIIVEIDTEMAIVIAKHNIFILYSSPTVILPGLVN